MAVSPAPFMSESVNKEPNLSEMKTQIEGPTFTCRGVDLVLLQVSVNIS